MRTSAAVALKDLLKLGDEDGLNDAIEREVRFCSFDKAGSKLIRQIKQVPSMDANNVHGGLSALTQIASLLSVTDGRRANVSWLWFPN